MICLVQQAKVCLSRAESPYYDYSQIRNILVIAENSLKKDNYSSAREKVLASFELMKKVAVKHHDYAVSEAMDKLHTCDIFIQHFLKQNLGSK